MWDAPKRVWARADGDIIARVGGVSNMFDYCTSMTKRVKNVNIVFDTLRYQLTSGKQVTRTRKTETQRRAEWTAAEALRWNEFYKQLENVDSLEGAYKLHSSAPPENAPGRRYYSNFGFFLHYFAPPHGANSTERAQYLRLIKLFDDAGNLSDGAREEIEQAFRQSGV